jgi:hypothetical protein
MGHVKEWYLQLEKAGNQYLGRVVCGLDVNSVKFAVLPPFFDFDGTNLDNRTSLIVYFLLRDYMVCGQSVSTSVHCIFYFCFAPLCFHFDFLTQVLHKKNKLQASHFFQHIPSNIQAAATVKYPWTKTEVTPTLTGLPPHDTIMTNFEQLKIEMEETKNATLSGVEAELDKRHIDSQSYFDEEEIISRMLLLNNKLLKKLDVCVCSWHPPRDDDDCFDEIFVNAEEEVAGKLLTIVLTNSDKKFHFFYSQGEVKRLPYDFVFPHMPLCAIVTNWFCRNPSAKTLPLKFLVPADFKNRGMK